MVYYLIVCRSLTYAQRTEKALTRAGITSVIVRSPKTIDSEGCSHAVKVAERNVDAALAVLARAGLQPKRLFRSAGDGGYREVFSR